MSVKNYTFISQIGIIARVPEDDLFEEHWHGELTYFMVLELLQGYTLNDYIECCRQTKKLIEPATWKKFMLMILDIIECLHKEKIIHGDLYPGNIYFDTNLNEIFVIDFQGSCEYTTAENCTINNFQTPDQFRLPFLKNDKTLKMLHNDMFELLKLGNLYSVVCIGLNLICPTLASEAHKHPKIFEIRNVLTDLAPLVSTKYKDEYGEEANAISQWIFDYGDLLANKKGSIKDLKKSLKLL